MFLKESHILPGILFFNNCHAKNQKRWKWFPLFICTCACVVADIELANCFYVLQGSVKQQLERQKYLHYE